MAENDSRRQAIDLWTFGKKVAIVGFLLIVALKVFVFSGERHWVGQSGGPVSAATPLAPSTPAAPKPAESVTATIAHKEARAHAEVQLSAFLELCGETETAISQLERLALEWESKTKDLLTGADGKRIAAQRESVIEAKALLDVVRPGRSTIERMRRSCAGLKAPAEEALRTPDSIWTPDKSQFDLRDLNTEARKASEEYRNAIAAITRLVFSAPSSGPAAVTLADAMDEIAAERGKAHAMELKKVADDAEAARQQREVEQAKDHNRKAAIARDPKALKLLDFTGLNRPGESTDGVWMACWAADAYASSAQFYEFANAGVSKNFNRGNYVSIYQMGDAIRAELNQRDQLAQTQFGMSLFELFKVVAVSEANQKRFSSDDAMRHAIESAQAKGNAKDAAQWAAILAKGKKLPKPIYP